MKNIFQQFLILFIGAFLLISCKKDFLTRTPQGSLSEDVLATSSGVKGLLTGAYAALDGQNLVSGGTGWGTATSNWIYGSVTGGDAHKGSQGGDQVQMNPIINFYADASNSFFDEKWRADYEGVSRCNQVLKVLKKVKDLSDADRDNIKGQALFLRAHYYFDLKKMFNNVPWIDETTTDFNQANDQDIWPKIEADLTFAMDSLPATQSKIGEANKWAAATYLAKAYLYQDKYDSAKSIFDQVVSDGLTSNGIKYGLFEQFEDNFRPEKEQTSPEAIFSVQMAANVGTGTVTNSNQGEMLNYPYPNSPWCCGFFQPSQDLVNSFRTNPATGLPYLDDYNLHPVKNDMGIASTEQFVPDDGTLDPRLDWTVGRRGIPYLDWGNHPGKTWIRDQAYGGPYSPKKNLYWQATQGQFYDGSSWAPGTAINYVLLSFSDVLLMTAECEAQLGNLDKAEEYVNRVRNRAADKAGWVYKYKNADDPLGGNSDIPAANYFIMNYSTGQFATNGKDYALKAIYFERKLELAMEGNRFFDLVRWGIADKTLNDYITYENKITTDLMIAHFTKGKNEYYPIPQAQIDLSTVGGKSMLIQNSGY
jgi:hypothetical protein